MSWRPTSTTGRVRKAKPEPHGWTRQCRGRMALSWRSKRGWLNEPSSSFGLVPVMLVVVRQLRRLIALTTSLLMMHLVIAGGVTACPMGDDVANPATAVETSHGVEQAGSAAGHNESMPGHENAPTRPAHHHTHSGSHCATPCPSSGCSALGHCGSVSLSATRDTGEPGLVAANGLIIARTNAVHSVSTAPEPPPPRA